MVQYWLTGTFGVQENGTQRIHGSFSTNYSSVTFMDCETTTSVLDSFGPEYKPTLSPTKWHYYSATDIFWPIVDFWHMLLVNADGTVY